MKFLKNYGLSLLLAAMFLISWIAQFFAGWIEFFYEQIQQNQEPQVLGPGGYIWHFLSATFENWQSEFFQTMIFVVFSTYLIHKNSPQSRDSDDEMMRRIKKIEKILEE